jgi:hypothetical protein
MRIKAVIYLCLALLLFGIGTGAYMSKAFYLPPVTMLTMFGGYFGAGALFVLGVKNRKYAKSDTAE